MEELFASDHGEGTLDIQGLGEIEYGTVGGSRGRKSRRWSHMASVCHEFGWKS